MRTRLLICLSIGLQLAQVHAQEPYDIMDWKTENSLRTYLEQNLHRQYDLRRLAIGDALRPEMDLAAYSVQIRKKFLDLLGEFPAPVPLHEAVTRKISCSGYTVENVIFQSRPSLHVTANFYPPDGPGPFPAVIMFCGHEMSSKATESYQRTAILFARNGFAPLMVDPVSQGERVQFTDPTGNRLLRGSNTEYTLLNAGASLLGDNIVTHELYDNVRSLDYRLSRPEVDTSRVGCPGNSGGGAQVSYFVAYDNRIKVAASCSYVASRERNYVMVADLRGMGETAEKPEANDWKYYNREYHNAIISLHPGRPLAGQRLDDVMTLLAHIHSDSALNGNRKITVIASGAAAPIAVYATMFESGIERMILRSTIRSFTEILENPTAKDWYSYVVPGILRYFDLPDLLTYRQELTHEYK